MIRQQHSLDRYTGSGSILTESQSLQKDQSFFAAQIRLADRQPLFELRVFSAFNTSDHNSFLLQWSKGRVTPSFRLYDTG
jgi:hypothetical protein